MTGLGIAAVLSGRPVPGQTAENGLLPVLRDAETTLLFDPASAGLQLVPAFSARPAFSTAEPAPLWTLRLKNETGPTLNLTAPGRQVDVVPTVAAVTLTWRDIAVPGGRLTVQVTGRLDETTPGLTRWRIAVDNASSCTLVAVDFPKLDIVGDPEGKDTLVMPLGQGVGLPNPSQSAALASLPRHYGFDAGNGTYPSTLCTLPLCLYYRDADNGGLFLAAFDPNGSAKQFRYTPRPDRRVVSYVMSGSVPHLSTPGKSYDQAFDSVIGVYRGDWYDACRIYRRWAIRQKWCSKGPLHRRADVPEWFKKAPLWLSAWLQPDSAMDLPHYYPDLVKQKRAEDPGFRRPRPSEPVLEFSRRLGSPRTMGFQWYAWSAQNPWFISFPHYGQVYDPDLPELCPHREAASEIRALTARGIHTVPYINVHLWEPTFPSYQKARAWTVKNAKGAPVRGYYRNINGYTHEEMAMCPFAEGYQDAMAAKLAELVNELGCAGLYLDQITAASPMACFDAAHGHPSGGGHWWVQGYRTLLTKVRQAVKAVNPQAILTSEVVGEPYIDLLDGNLGIGNNFANLVPMYKVIYGDYTLIYGRSPRMIETNPDGFNQVMGQMFVNGEALGWFGVGAVVKALLSESHERERRYLEHLVAAFTYAQPFNVEGVMRRPLALAIDADPAVFKGRLGQGEYPFTAPAVLNAVYSTHDGRLGILLTNHTGSPRRVEASVTLEDYGLPGKTFRVTAWSRNGEVASDLDTGRLHINCIMAPHSAVVHALRATDGR